MKCFFLLHTSRSEGDVEKEKVFLREAFFPHLPDLRGGREKMLLRRKTPRRVLLKESPDRLFSLSPTESGEEGERKKFP